MDEYNNGWPVISKSVVKRAIFEVAVEMLRKPNGSLGGDYINCHVLTSYEATALLNVIEATRVEKPACDGCGLPGTVRCLHCQAVTCGDCSTCENFRGLVPRRLTPVETSGQRAPMHVAGERFVQKFKREPASASDAAWLNGFVEACSPLEPRETDGVEQEFHNIDDVATIRQLKEAVYWALGERDEFPEEPEPLAGKYRRRYHWRTELRRRSGLPINGITAEEPKRPQGSPGEILGCTCLMCEFHRSAEAIERQRRAENGKG